MSAVCGPATSLIPGDPEAVEWLAREYGRYAAGACDAARALRRIDTGSWVGPAGASFRAAIGEIPAKLDRGQSAFARAAGALADYARVLRDAQADAAAAVRRYADGEAATASWRGQVAAHEQARSEEEARAAAAGRTPPPDTGRPSSYDPGADDRAAAEHLLQSAQQRVEAAARRSAAVVQDARQGAPHEPGLLSRALHAAGSFFAGAGEATWGLAKLTFELSPTYALVDPKGFLDNAENLAKGVVLGIEHPKELGKALIDYDTWKRDPARALGHLVPDLVLMLATAGAGEGAAAAGRLAEGAEVASELGQRGAGVAAREAGLSEAEATALEERFGSPATKALSQQGDPRYPGRDAWFDRMLQPGARFSVGRPGQGRFVAAHDAVEQVGTDARAYNEGLQVQSFKGADGVARYRPELVHYEVRRPLPVAESFAQANPQFGAGGLRQYFVPDDLEQLVAEGYVQEVGTTTMTNLDAVIGPKGIVAAPSLRAPIIVGSTLAADRLVRAGGAR
jgi:hypothetical protein